MPVPLTQAEVDEHNAKVARGRARRAILTSPKAVPATLIQSKTIRARSSYQPAVVLSLFTSAGLPEPVFEYRFHPVRKWRFDLAWPDFMLYLECDGGIWIAGGHNRGAQMKKDWEKRNSATVVGWRGLWIEPKDLCTQATVDLVRLALDRSKT